jgi:hypothetical protein
MEKVSVLITSPVRQKWSMVPPTTLIVADTAVRTTNMTCFGGLPQCQAQCNGAIKLGVLESEQLSSVGGFGPDQAGSGGSCGNSAGGKAQDVDPSSWGLLARPSVWRAHCGDDVKLRGVGPLSMLFLCCI